MNKVWKPSINWKRLNSTIFTRVKHPGQVLLTSGWQGGLTLEIRVPTY